MCAGLREETWPFSFQLLLLNKVNQIAKNSRQPKFNVEEKKKKKKSLFTKRAFEKLTRTLVFSNPAVTGKQATAVGTQRLVLGKHLWECCIFYIAWLPVILAAHRLLLSKIHCCNFLRLIVLTAPIIKQTKYFYDQMNENILSRYLLGTYQHR